MTEHGYYQPLHVLELLAWPCQRWDNCGRRETQPLTNAGAMIAVSRRLHQLTMTAGQIVSARGRPRVPHND